jgi:misacylated tRNA(Ala) deacylase
MTRELFRDDAYLTECSATVLAVNQRNGLILDQTIFYPTGGGQPGDSGTLECNGQLINIATTINDRETGQLVHVIEERQNCLKVGDKVIARINWQKRYQYMRMHSALHLLCAVVPCGVTGGQIGEIKSRLDFDIGDSNLNKEQISAALNRLIDEDHFISTQWISDEELDNNPALVRTMSVQPPRGVGKIRLLKVGDTVDLQPCGGTHVKHTGEIGAICISKIENKGKRNRRVNIVFSNL